MEPHPYEHHNNHFSDVSTGTPEFAAFKLNYDSRYRNIIGQLDVLVELVRQQPGRRIVTELDHLLDVMMGHIGLENNYMALMRYPHETRHRNHHYYLFVITDDLSQRFTNGQNVLLKELTNLRLLWLTHIQLHDQGFEEFLLSTTVGPGDI